METVVPMTVTDTAVFRRVRLPRPSAPVGSEPRSALIRKLDAPLFAGLPDAAATIVRERLGEALSGRRAEPRYAHLTADLRAAIVDILRETRPDLATASQ